MSSGSPRRRTFPSSVAMRIPGIGTLARQVARVAGYRVGRVPVGLVALLPVALLLDFFDFADELLGPAGVLASFFLETAFVLGLTDRAGYAFGFAGIDLVPGVDVLPVATLTLLGELARAWREGADVARPSGPVIDV